MTTIKNKNKLFSFFSISTSTQRLIYRMSSNVILCQVSRCDAGGFIYSSAHSLTYANMARQW